MNINKKYLLFCAFLTLFNHLTWAIDLAVGSGTPLWLIYDSGISIRFDIQLRGTTTFYHDRTIATYRITKALNPGQRCTINDY